jgi:hypothetical protein
MTPSAAGGSEIPALKTTRWMPITAAALLGLLMAWRASSTRPVPGDSTVGPPDISSLNGTTLPRLQVSALTAGQSEEVPDSALMIFVRPRCVASRRLMTLIEDELDTAKSEVPVILAMVGEPDEVQRLAAASGQCRRVHVLASRLPGEIRGAIPCGIMLAPGWRVRHAGGMSDAPAVARFVEACGDKRIRQWFNGLPAESASGPR